MSAFVSEMFILIKGNVCMMHGPMGGKSYFLVLQEELHHYDKYLAFWTRLHGALSDNQVQCIL